MEDAQVTGNMIKNIRGATTTIRSSQESIGLIPVQDALAMINQFD
jgi:hypothetical protein